MKFIHVIFIIIITTGCKRTESDFRAKSNNQVTKKIEQNSTVSFDSIFKNIKEIRKETWALVNPINKKQIALDIPKQQHDDQLTISEMKTFFNRLGNICKTNKNDISKQLSSNVLERYPEFCNMFDIVSAQREGEIQFDIIENEGGVITINSVEIIEDDGYKHRNEYSTLLYIKKINNELIINDLGGAG